jgi:hypothetical protein
MVTLSEYIKLDDPSSQGVVRARQPRLTSQASVREAGHTQRLTHNRVHCTDIRRGTRRRTLQRIRCATAGAMTCPRWSGSNSKAPRKGDIRVRVEINKRLVMLNPMELVRRPGGAFWPGGS